MKLTKPVQPDPEKAEPYEWYKYEEELKVYGEWKTRRDDIAIKLMASVLSAGDALLDIEECIEIAEKIIEKLDE